MDEPQDLGRRSQPRRHRQLDNLRSLAAYQTTMASHRAARAAAYTDRVSRFREAEATMRPVATSIPIFFVYPAGRNLLFAIERRADGLIYDVTTKRFSEAPKQGRGGMQERDDLGHGVSLYLAALGRAAAVTEGEYLITVFDTTAGGGVVSMSLLQVDHDHRIVNIGKGIVTATAASKLPPPTAAEAGQATRNLPGRAVLLRKPSAGSVD